MLNCPSEQIFSIKPLNLLNHYHFQHVRQETKNRIWEARDRRRVTGIGRREKETEERRREKGEGRKEKGDMRQDTLDGRRETGKGRQEKRNVARIYKDEFYS